MLSCCCAWIGATTTPYSIASDVMTDFNVRGWVTQSNMAELSQDIINNWYLPHNKYTKGSFEAPTVMYGTIDCCKRQQINPRPTQELVWTIHRWWSFASTQADGTAKDTHEINFYNEWVRESTSFDFR